MSDDLGSGGARILAVCSHNRTRSVMAMAMMQGGFDRIVGPGRVSVSSLGFGPEGEPAIPAAVEAMSRRGLDVSGHTSRRVTPERIELADLVLTAEKDHVIAIGSSAPDVYRRTFTLPEFVDRIGADPDPGGRSLREWVTSLSDGRTASVYLRSAIPEVADPTGFSRRRFERATSDIERQCWAVIEAVARAL